MVGAPIAQTALKARELLIRSAGSAIREAGLDEDCDLRRVGLIVGSFDVEAWLGGRVVRGSWVDKLSRDEELDPILRRFGQGRKAFLSTACASGLDAVGLAHDWLGRGRIDICLVVCGEVPSETTVAGMSLLRTLSPKGVARPLDEARDGTTIQAGCAALVLESREAADARGACPSVAVVGYGSCSDIESLVAPDSDGQGIRKSMRRALDMAAVDEIDAVCAHASGTRLGDSVELTALEDVVPGSCPLVTANKGLLGHTLGASGAINAVEAVAMIRRGSVPPIVSTTDPVATERIELVTGAPRDQSLRRVLTNAVGFGGQNSSVVFESVK